VPNLTNLLYSVVSPEKVYVLYLVSSDIKCMLLLITNLVIADAIRVITLADCIRVVLLGS
jgi:hypothetical protein